MMRLAMEQGILEVFQQHYYSWDEKVGVGDIIEKIIDCRYIGIFSSYRQIIDIEKKQILELSKNYQYQVLCRPSGGGPRLDRWARIQSGRVNFGVFSTSRFVPSALSSDFFTTMYFSPTLLRFSLTFHLLFRTFDVLLGWILLREYLFLENNIPDLGFLGLSNAIYMKLP